MQQPSILLQESNRLTDAINSYKNTVCEELNGLLAGYGLTEPMTIEQLNGLTLRQQGSIFQALGSAVTAIGREISSRTVEATLASAGYTGIEDAVADTPNHFTGGARAAIEGDLSETRAALQVTDSQLDAVFLLDLLGRVLAVKNAVVSAASRMSRV